MESLGAVLGPLIGLFIVALAYCLGIILSVKCCRPEYDSFSDSFMPSPRREVLEPNLDIFIVSRSEDYLFNIPRPTLIATRHGRSRSETSESPGPAPEYEEPPSYEECIKSYVVEVGIEGKTSN